MSLSTLPDLCLLTILDRIPLYDLLATVNRVCHRWASLRPIACHRRRSLILNERKTENHWLTRKFTLQFDDWLTKDVTNDDGSLYNEPKYHLEHNTLTIKPKSFMNLIHLFPNLTSFQFGQRIYCWKDSLKLIVHLLKECSDKLVHLNLYLFENNFHTRDSFHLDLLESLFYQINQLSSLKRLRIQTESWNINPKFDTKLTVLRQVEQLECHASFEDYIIDNIEDALKSENCSLKRIYLGPSGTLDCSSPRLHSLLTDYDLIIPDNLNEFYIKMSRFSTLECLTIDMLELNLQFVQFISSISHLSKLTFLKIFTPLKAFYDRTDVVPSEMPSVKIFNIQVDAVRSHRQLKNLPLAIVFPNIQVITFGFYKLTCSAFITKTRSCPKKTCSSIIKCPQKVLRPLKQCAKLRKIYFGKEVLTPDQL